jgi:ABC-2 type transport system ATP-binding protein
MADENVIEAVELTKVFKDFWTRPKVRAVTDLTFHVRRGEVYGFLGPNGSGKTTTIRMMLGLLRPTRGLVRVLGLPPHNVKAKARLGYLPEESYLYRYLNAREILDFYGRLFDIRRAERKRRIESLLELVGLVGVGRRSLSEYSKGMARRIGLAQALINDPELLILDEPTTGLDPIGTREIKDMILSLKKRGKTVFLSSHLLADVEDVCDRIAILYGGRLTTEGRVSALLAQTDATQIRTGRVSEETIARIREILAGEAGAGEVTVETPRENLESLFLRVVRKARREHRDTAGAVAGRARGDFLVGPKREEPADVVASLVKGDADAPAPAPPAAAAPPERQDVVGDLVAARDGTEADAPAEEKAPEPPPPEEDRSVIDDLTRDGDGR